MRCWSKRGPPRVLLDCGFGPREVAFRLGRLGLAAEDLAGILITHEHSDHAAGALQAGGHGIELTIRMTHGTRCHLAGGAELPGVEFIDSHQPLRIGDLEVHPFPVPHDAREPVQFVFSDGSIASAC
jgi:phosphoribosyl 1,2-cyclic phosphodiesterase